MANTSKIVDSSINENLFESLKNPEKHEALSYNYELLPRFMLTTKDNPFNPFDDFDSWYQFDEAKGYRTCGLVARLAHSSSGLSWGDQQISIALAIDEVLSTFPFYEVVVPTKRNKQT